LIGAYWVAYRPLAQTSGQIRRGFRSSVHRQGCAWYPAHYRANWERAISCKGYAPAQDGFGMMDACGD